MSIRAASPALAAALLFGASTPLAKLLVGATHPLLLAGLLYLGSGFGLGALLLARRVRPRTAGAEKASMRIPRKDRAWLAGAILFGGVLGPALLMAGLARTSGASASLLLNVEGVFTAVLAWVAFRENADRRIVLGMVAIVAGGALLARGGIDGARSLAARAGAARPHAHARTAATLARASARRAPPAPARLRLAGRGAAHACAQA